MKRPRKVRRSFIGMIIPLGVVVLFVVALCSGWIHPTPFAGSLSTPSVAASTTQSPAPSQEKVTSSPSALPTFSPKPAQASTQPIKLVGQPSRLIYKAAGINLPIAMMEQEVGPFVPPDNKDSAYWLTKRPGYLLAHSAELEKWPFNALTTAAHEGDLIELVTPSGVVYYKVISVAFYPKHDLEIDGKTPVWDIDDRLLRLIGCKDGDVWQQVTVVTAVIESGG